MILRKFIFLAISCLAGLWSEIGLSQDPAVSAEKTEKAEKTAVAAPGMHPCGERANDDGEPYNRKQGLTLRLGPPGVQFGHSNPLGIPPGPQDISITYVWKCGYELNTDIVPGPTFGIRYRGGRFLYGSYGGGLLVTANGMGPGVYTAIGASIARDWPVTIELEFKQGLGVSIGEGGSHIITPYAFRIGAGVWW